MKNSLLFAGLLLSGPAVAETGCPTDFFQTPLYPDARFCQTFNDKLPATLSYHANSGIDETADFYLQQLGNPGSDEMLKGRRVLQFEQGQKIVVLSVDGQGTQIDILVKQSSPAA
ncbi:hypothetical protein [Neptunicella sp. SCSIO 80796]|uniref:hypothetical protein n=1 Tax=Neptunicella plasticusilytica TaxID=3117012 RepID=UPI003A4D9B4C